jgi:hypothetical protein
LSDVSADATGSDDSAQFGLARLRAEHDRAIVA